MFACSDSGNRPILKQPRIRHVELGCTSGESASPNGYLPVRTLPIFSSVSEFENNDPPVSLIHHKEQLAIVRNLHCSREALRKSFSADLPIQRGFSDHCPVRCAVNPHLTRVSR